MVPNSSQGISKAINDAGGHYRPSSIIYTSPDCRLVTSPPTCPAKLDCLLTSPLVMFWQTTLQSYGDVRT